MTAATPEAEHSDLIRRMAQTLAADAAEYGSDLADPTVRQGFKTGLTVSLGWITSAHKTGKIDDASFEVLEELFSAAVASLEAETGSRR